MLLAVPAGADAAAPPTLTVRDSRYRQILFDGAGRPLYAFTRDAQHGASRCYGACAMACPDVSEREDGPLALIYA